MNRYYDSDGNEIYPTTSKEPEQQSTSDDIERYSRDVINRKMIKHPVGGCIHYFDYLKAQAEIEELKTGKIYLEIKNTDGNKRIKELEQQIDDMKYKEEFH